MDEPDDEGWLSQPSDEFELDSSVVFNSDLPEQENGGYSEENWESLLSYCESLKRPSYKSRYQIEKGKTAKLREDIKKHKGEITTLKRLDKDQKTVNTHLQTLLKRIKEQDQHASDLESFLKTHDLNEKLTERSPFHKSPPRNVEIEQKIIGILLNNPSKELGISKKYLNMMFYKHSHKLIHSAILTLSESTDITTVSAELRRHGVLEDCGGVSYLTELAYPSKDQTRDLVLKEYFILLKNAFLNVTLSTSVQQQQVRLMTMKKP